MNIKIKKYDPQPEDFVHQCYFCHKFFNQDEIKFFELEKDNDVTFENVCANCETTYLGDEPWQINL